LFGEAGTGSAVGVQVILSEMKTAVEKLRENMDQIQQQIDDSLGRLERSSLSINLEILEFHFAD
jgi:hypothetical protein